MFGADSDGCDVSDIFYESDRSDGDETYVARESDALSDCFEIAPDADIVDADGRLDDAHARFDVPDVEDAPRMVDGVGVAYAIDVAPSMLDAVPRERFAGEAIVWLPNGAKITAYSYDIFECRCACRRHGSCVKTKRRTGVALARGNPAQGRPLGYLVAWALDAENFAHTQGADGHMAHTPSYERRVEARAFLRAMETDSSRQLFLAERPMREGEPDGEPLECP